MKKLIILFFSFILSNQFYAQESKTAIKLNDLNEKKEYAKTIKYKQGKENSFDSKALYYKAMAYYMTSDNTNALKFFDLAITTKPVDAAMYYHRGMTQYFMTEHEKSVADFDQAIELNDKNADYYLAKGDALYELTSFDLALKSYTKATQCETDQMAIVYTAIALVDSDLKDYESSIDFYKKALDLLQPNTATHQKCGYQLALVQQQDRQYKQAKYTLKNHLNQYPKDFEAISTLIQIHYVLDEIKQTESLKKKLLTAYNKNELPTSLDTMYCFDQFDWNNQRILVYESYEENPQDILIWKHKVIIKDSLNEFAYEIQTIKDSSATEKSDELYIFSLIKDDSITTYKNYTFNSSIDYFKFKNAVLDILNNKATPTATLPNYQEWLNDQYSKNSDGTGSSFRNAITVESIPDEYKWVRRHYPNSKMVMQSLVFNDGIPYDILKFKTENGKVKQIYFNISTFFGKGF